MEEEGKGTGEKEQRKKSRGKRAEEKEQRKRTEAGNLAGGENGCYNGQQKMRKRFGRQNTVCYIPYLIIIKNFSVLQGNVQIPAVPDGRS